LKMPSHASDPAARPPSTARLLIPNPHPNLSGEPGGVVLMQTLPFSDDGALAAEEEFERALYASATR